MTLDQVAERTGRSVELLRRWAREGRIQAIQVGRTWVVREEDIDSIEALPQRGIRSGLTVRAHGFNTDPPKADLRTLAAELAAAAGMPAKVASPIARPPHGGPPWPLDVLRQYVEVFLPHAADALIGAVITAFVNWARRRHRSKTAIQLAIYGPDGQVIRTVEVKSARGKPKIIDETEVRAD